MLGNYFKKGSSQSQKAKREIEWKRQDAKRKAAKENRRPFSTQPSLSKSITSKARLGTASADDARVSRSLNSALSVKAGQGNRSRNGVLAGPSRKRKRAVHKSLSSFGKKKKQKRLMSVAEAKKQKCDPEYIKYLERIHANGPTYGALLTENNGTVKADDGREDRETDPAPVCVVTLYSHGYSLKDSKAGPDSDPEYRDMSVMHPLKREDFFDQIARKGKHSAADKDEMPHQLKGDLMKLYRLTQNVKLDIRDNRKENYTPPKRFQAFSGEGKRLGTARAFSKVGKLSVSVPSKEYKAAADSNCTMQLLLTDGEKSVVKMSPDALVKELYAHAKHVSGLFKFDLVAGFPPKPLLDGDIGVIAAGLKGSRIRMRTW